MKKVPLLVHETGQFLPQPAQDARPSGIGRLDGYTQFRRDVCPRLAFNDQRPTRFPGFLLKVASHQLNHASEQMLAIFRLPYGISLVRRGRVG